MYSMLVTNSFFYYLLVKNKPCVYWAYAFILEYSTITKNSYLYNKNKILHINFRAAAES
jgi:hypothetical protein